MVAKAKMALDGLSTSLQVFPETRPVFSQWMSGTQNPDKVKTLKHLKLFQASLPLYSTQRLFGVINFNVTHVITSRSKNWNILSFYWWAILPGLTGHKSPEQKF